MDPKRAVQAQFGRVAQSYSTSTVFSQGVDLDVIGREAASAGPSRALDVGTAAGHVAFTLAPHARLVVGLDLTHPMLATARDEASARGIGNLRLCQADVEQLPFPGGSFDLVTCRFSGHHFPSPDRFAREAGRVLGSGGRLILADVVSPADDRQDRWINQVELLRDPSHVRDYKLAEWRGLLGAAGLATEVLLEWRLDLDFEDWTRRQRTPPERVEQIRSLFRQAPADQREAFGLRMPADGRWFFQLHC
ncbi:MAG TPA: methyltransferase domain-containing protein, partial [Chloroflexota bacterium]